MVRELRMLLPTTGVSGASPNYEISFWKLDSRMLSITLREPTLKVMELGNSDGVLRERSGALGCHTLSD
jgi:hypothetical protein